MGDGAATKSNVSQIEPTMKGWLFKWTNYLKGYQRRWFVLQNGHLSYYRFVFIFLFKLIGRPLARISTSSHSSYCVVYSENQLFHNISFNDKTF